jgi:hypothetical protein
MYVLLKVANNVTKPHGALADQVRLGGDVNLAQKIPVGE